MKVQNAIKADLEALVEIHNWTPRITELVEILSANFRKTSDEMTIKSGDYSIKTLDVKWNPNPDHFCFIAKLDEKAPSTKRQILSEVTRFFDPLGWLSPTSSSLFCDYSGWTDMNATKLCRKVFSNSTADSEFNWGNWKILHNWKYYKYYTVPSESVLSLLRCFKVVSIQSNFNLTRVVSISPATSDIEFLVFCDASTTT